MELTFDHMTLRLGARAVIRDLSATLRPGRVTAIVGPNGAGKSSLVRAAAGLLPVTEGAARLGGEPIARLDPRARARAIGYLPQDTTVHWNVPARDVVALGRLPHRSPFAAASAADRAAIDAALARTDATALADRSIHTLSGGERARILFARVLAGEPRWLIADEPLASLDPAHQFALLALARAVAEAGAGVVLVLHDLAHARRVADDVMVLDRGTLAGFGPAAEVLNPAMIARVFGVRARDVAGHLLLDGPAAG